VCEHDIAKMVYVIITATCSSLRYKTVFGWCNYRTRELNVPIRGWGFC